MFPRRWRVGRWLGRAARAPEGGAAAAPSLPLLEPVREPAATAWLRTSMTTFARDVASFLPGHFEAYARVYHPAEFNAGTSFPAPPWRALAAAADVDLVDPRVFDALRESVEVDIRVAEGSLAVATIDALVEHLARATTSERWYFAVWEGGGASVIPPTVTPTLELPHRRYHVFAGPAAGARTSFASRPFGHQSANLWWPGDRTWCVATEVDLPWTYVGGPRALIRALVADPRLESFQTVATAPW